MKVVTVIIHNQNLGTKVICPRGWSWDANSGRLISRPVLATLPQSLDLKSPFPPLPRAMWLCGFQNSLAQATMIQQEAIPPLAFGTYYSQQPVCLMPKCRGVSTLHRQPSHLCSECQRMFSAETWRCLSSLESRTIMSLFRKSCIENAFNVSFSFVLNDCTSLS